MANIFKKVIDRQAWASSTPAPTAHSAAVCLVSDLRSDVSRNPFVYQIASASLVNRYNIVTKGWHLLANPGMAAFAAGAAGVFAPSFSAQGTIAAGATTTKISLTTALPAAVGVNMLANRGGSGDYGFKVRIIGFTAGKTEERFIIGNTGGTTPTLLLDNPLTFTPTSSDRYELLSGRVMMLSSGAPAGASWRSMEVATNVLASLAFSGLPTVGTDSSLVCLDEQYTPYDCNPGEGFIKGTFQYDNNVSTRMALAATATGAGSITGQATGGDAAVVANEYRNFQIRIVHDAVTPASVGQRRIIASHTGPGASPVYTLGTNWTTTPSSSAKFVIEYPNLIILRTAATTQYTYNYTDATVNNGTNNITANAWSTTYFAAAANAGAAGMMWMPSFGIRPDSEKNARHSHLFCWRGSSANLDLFDISNTITGAWTNAIVIDGGITTTGSMSGCYAPFENEGRMFYMNPYTASQVSQIFRFDVQNRVLSPYTPTDEIQAGTAAVGNRIACYAAIDGTDTYDCVLLQSHLAVRTQELIPLV